MMEIHFSPSWESQDFHNLCNVSLRYKKMEPNEFSILLQFWMMLEAERNEW